jgi:uncharacterized membrane protein
MQRRESAVLVLVLLFFGVFIQSLGLFLMMMMMMEGSSNRHGFLVFYPPFAVFINVFVLLMSSSSFCHKYNMPTLVGGHSVYWDIPH